MFETPTSKQFESVKWLAEALIKEYSLDLNKDVYAHGVIDRKKETEGIRLLQYLRTGISP